MKTIVINKIDRKKHPSYYSSKILDHSRKNRVHIKIPNINQIIEPNTDPIEIIKIVMMCYSLSNISSKHKKTSS